VNEVNSQMLHYLTKFFNLLFIYHEDYFNITSINIFDLISKQISFHLNF
jgi:hypothetical protein